MTSNIEEQEIDFYGPADNNNHLERYPSTNPYE